MPSLLDELSLEVPDSVDNHETEKAVRQFLKRKRKIRRKRLGKQRSWLLVSLSRLGDGERPEDWVRRELGNLIKIIPNSAYKRMVLGIVYCDELNENFSKQGLFSYHVLEGLHITALPISGIFAFKAPPGNLKKNLEFAKIPCEWNWALGSNFHRNDRPRVVNEGILKAPEYFSDLHIKYDRGEGTTIGIIDCGICQNSEECAERVIWQGMISDARENDEFRISTAPDDFKPIDHHGTQVAALAAGKSIGMAPEAEIVSIIMPMDELEFDQYALYFAIEQILLDEGMALGGVPLREKLDTLLIPGGVLFEGKIRAEFRDKSVMPMFLDLHNVHNICVIAAVGNESGKVTFPANFQLVHAVGALTENGRRHPNSGYGHDNTSGILPNSNVLGTNILSEGLENTLIEDSGTSFAAATVGGLFTLLATRYPDSGARWTRIAQSTIEELDEFGRLNVLDIEALR